MHIPFPQHDKYLVPENLKNFTIIIATLLEPDLLYPLLAVASEQNYKYNNI